MTATDEGLLKLAAYIEGAKSLSINPGAGPIPIGADNTATIIAALRTAAARSGGEAVADPKVLDELDVLIRTEQTGSRSTMAIAERAVAEIKRLARAAPARSEVGGETVAVATALARRLCQMFDSGGESQRTARARHASAIFQLLESVGLGRCAEQEKCDADPVGYLEAAEALALAAPVLPSAVRSGDASFIRWQQVNDEPIEYAIQQGPHGDEFVKLLDGSCLRRASPNLQGKLTGSDTSQREVVARIIDPDCAEALVTEQKWCERYGKNFEIFAAGYIKRWDDTLAKAGAILAALSPSSAIRGGALPPWQINEIASEHQPATALTERIDLSNRIKMFGPGVLAMILKTYASAQPSQGSFAGSLWAIAEWMDTHTALPHQGTEEPGAGEAVRLFKALQNYGRHDDDCAIKQTPLLKCSCGFHAALAPGLASEASERPAAGPTGPAGSQIAWRYGSHETEMRPNCGRRGGNCQCQQATECIYETKAS